MMPQPQRQANQRTRQATTAASPPQSSADAQRQCGPFRAFGRGDFAGWGTTSPRRQPLAATRGPEVTAGGAPWTNSAAWKAVLAPARGFSRVLAELAIPSFLSSLFCSLPPSSADMLCFVVVSPSDCFRSKQSLRMELAVPTCRNQRQMQLLPFHPRLSIFFPGLVSPAS